MTKRMLIDAIHPEETRVVVLDGSKVEEFDFEAASKRPLKGNIYLAKVTRVEPSLQAAFVEYGGNRQGFLAFAEIHPDYYQIPVADRQALLAEQEAEARRRQEDDIESFEITGSRSGDSEVEEEPEEDIDSGEEQAEMAPLVPLDAAPDSDDLHESSAEEDDHEEVFVNHGGDGMRVDRKGNLYTTGGGGGPNIQITSPEGKPLGRLLLPQPAGEPRTRVCATNVAFGDNDDRTLFITACTHLFKIRLKQPGVRPGRKP